MNPIEKTSKKNLASKELWRQIFGGMLKRPWLLLLVLLTIVPLIIHLVKAQHPCTLQSFVESTWLKLFCLTFIVALIVSVCHTLTDIFSLRKKESGITWCQISILIAIGLWIIGFIIIFDIQKDSKYSVALGIVGTMLAWIFQDTLRGVVAFIHLRLNHLLRIDDWIIVPKYNVDGEVKKVTLTSVSVQNWDTTTSSIPTSALHADHFINLQNMANGKTYGRLMMKNFILDTTCFHPLTEAEAQQMRQTEDIVKHLPEEEIKEGVLNAHLYRLYLFHWLMNNPRVSQMPRLIVRWMEQVEKGMPLQVYAHLLDSGFTSFEWQQSLIMEHIVESMDWFGMRMYQSPTSQDVKQGLDILNANTNGKEARL